MKILSRYQGIIQGKLSSQKRAFINHNYALLFHNQYYFRQYKQKDPVKSSPDIWKRLNIQLMKSQLQICDLPRGKQKQASERLYYERNKLIQTLKKIQKDIKKNQIQYEKQLLQFEITPSMLIQDFESLCDSISKLNFQGSKAYMGTHYYQSLNYYIINAKEAQYLTRFAFIMKIFIKYKFLLQVNKINHKPNILNSSPSQFKQAWKRIEIITFDQAKLEKDYSTLKIGMHIIVGILQEMNAFNQSTLISLLKSPYYFTVGFINHQKRILQSLPFFKRPSANSIQVLNRLEQGAFGRITEITLPQIKTNKMIYIPSRGPFESKIDIFEKVQGSIPVRILSCKQLPNLSSTQQPVQQAMIHIHGGGLLLFTSFITQNHTRLWANQTGLLIFSIDYKLAPKHPFPQGLDDCLQVYKFLTQEIHKYLNVKLKTTFIGGDSAGGNLSSALTALILKNKLLKPKSLFLIYPSLDLRKIYYQSRQYTLIDPVLWPSLAIMVMDTYLKNEEEANHPLASPLLLTEQYISGKKGDKSFPKEWPRTFIIVGTKDPLRDECLLFMQRMTSAGIDCQCKLLQGWRHGFMNTDIFIRQSEIPFKISVQIVKKMMQKAKKQ